jgi:tetratricopeptide (TPR) repeat protein
MNIRCPITTCGEYNSFPVSKCKACGVDLRAYATALRFHDICFNRALSFACSRDYISAQQELHACLKFCPDDAEAMLLLGKIYLAAGDRSKAIETWRRLLDLSIDDRIKGQTITCVQAAEPCQKGHHKPKRKRGRKRS